MTLEENLADLVSHAERSARGVDLAYTVLDQLEGAVVGCVYLKPARDPLSVQVLSWVSAARAELDGPLTQVVGDWLLADWPFTSVRYRRGPDRCTLRRPLNPRGPTSAVDAALVRTTVVSTSSDPRRPGPHGPSATGARGRGCRSWTST